MAGRRRREGGKGWKHEQLKWIGRKQTGQMIKWLRFPVPTPQDTRHEPLLSERYSSRKKRTAFPTFSPPRAPAKINRYLSYLQRYTLLLPRSLAPAVSVQQRARALPGCLAGFLAGPAPPSEHLTGVRSKSFSSYKMRTGLTQALRTDGFSGRTRVFTTQLSFNGLICFIFVVSVVGRT